MRGNYALLSVLVLVGCGGNQASPAAAEPDPAAPPAEQPATAKAPSPGLPDGYITTFALGMLRIDTASGAVILADEKRTVFVPIFIGGTESLSISHRLKGEPFKRPLTHDLVDSILKETGAELVQVQVDALRDSTFHGSILIRDGDRIVKIDARPSDAIALATGNAIPIYVSQSVVDQTGIPSDDPRAEAYKIAIFARTADANDIILKFEDLADKACACADAACLQAVQFALMNLIENAPELSMADRQEIMKSVERMQACFEKLPPASP